MQENITGITKVGRYQINWARDEGGPFSGAITLGSVTMRFDEHEELPFIIGEFAAKSVIKQMEKDFQDELENAMASSPCGEGWEEHRRI